MRDRGKTPSIATTLKGGELVLHARTTLVLYHREGASVAQLEKHRPLVIGRAAPSDITIPDPNLSRTHAQFTWDDDAIWVEDLGSTNGTKKNGKKIDRTRVEPGDVVTIGPVRVAIHILSSSDHELRGFDGHDRFLAALDDELTRARTFKRSLALVMVQSTSKDGHVSRWAHRIRGRLRAVDRVGIYGPSAMIVLLPECGAEEARVIAASLSGGDPPLTCNVAVFPSHGTSVDELIAAVQNPERASRESGDLSAVVIKNAAMKDVMASAERLAHSQITVLVLGETGTGKEVIARAIHDAGPRKKHPLRTINCGALPGSLIESVLFGHEQGAFTGADKPVAGIFEQGNGGTVLLDEIGELSPSAQAALLRVLETKQVTRIGGTKEIAVDVRVVAATHRDLEAMVATGAFRGDLWYRLNSVTLKIPPLRERVDEIRPLAERFLKEATKHARSNVKSIDAQALAALEAYSWPGNVRELRNVIERAVVLAEGKSIELQDLPERVRRDREVDAVDAPLSSGVVPSDYREHVRKFEIDLILKALHKYNGNQTEAAKALNLPLRTLVHKMKTYGIKKKFDR
jgi:DNA-binding NtrC family response regulator